jgi:hypothetical protein
MQKNRVIKIEKKRRMKENLGKSLIKGINFYKSINVTEDNCQKMIKMITMMPDYFLEYILVSKESPSL